ncbi:MAG: MBL fold metallo-hydrolase [Desulfurococcaceae archaeon]|nr:MBL fold metallo-hydrolase [Desulfurococcaceae archaeon]
MTVYRVDVCVLNDDYSGFTKLLSSHGLSLHVRIYSDNGIDNLLLDVGPSNRIIKYNSELLGLDLSDVKAVVLSHRHYDHTGGLKHVLRVSNSVGKRLTVIAHPWIFKPSITLSSDKQEFDKGMPYSYEELITLKPNLILTKSSLRISDSTYYLGEIGNYIDLSKYKEGFYTVLDDGELVPDNLPDDTGLSVKVEGLGLIVLSGCSHSGIANIVKQASETLKENVYAVVGGLHMLKYSEDDIRESIRILKDLGVESVYVGHCTGFKAEKILSDEFRDKFYKIHTGFKITFKGG